MNLIVLTPEKEIFQGTITSIKVPGTVGQFQVLKNHAPIVSSLEEGKVQIVTAGGRVLNLTGVGPDAATARDRAYDAAEAVNFDGKQMRRDIAERAVRRERELDQ